MSPALPTILRQQGLPSPYRINGLQAYYDAKEASSLTYTAATGATSLMADLSGNSNTNVINFNGTAGCTVANIPVHGTGDFTYVFWVTPSNTADEVLCSSAANGLQISINNVAGNIRLTQSGVAHLVTTAIGVTAGSLQQLVCVRASGVVTWYRNAVSTAGGADTTNFSVATTILYSASGSGYFSGNVQNTLIYNRALSAGEVATLYATGVPSAADTYGAGINTAINAGSFVVGKKYRIASAGNTDFTLIGAANSNVGTEFTATGVGAGTGNATALGLLLKPTTPFTRGATTIADGSGLSATITLPASGVWISGARDLAQVTGANQPIYLPWSGTNYLWCPGVAGNYATTASSTATNPAGSIEIVARATMPSWTNSTGTYFPFWSKYQSDSNRGYEFVIPNGASTLLFRYTPDGTDASKRVATSSSNLPFAAGATGWVKVTYNSATGKVNFYTGTDTGSNVEPTWSLLGAEQTITAGTAFAGTNAITVGAYSGGTPPSGSILYSALKSGIGGSVAAVMSASETTDGSSSWTASTGEVWTVNTSGGKPALIVGRPGVLFDGSAFYLKSAPFALNQPTWVVFIGKQLTFSNNACLFAGNVNGSTLVFQDTTTPNISLYSGSTVATNTGLALKTTAVVTAVFNGASSSLNINNGVATTGNPGVANAGGFTVGVNGGGATGFANILVNAVAVFSTAPTAADLRKLVQYFGKRWAITV